PDGGGRPVPVSTDHSDPATRRHLPVHCAGGGRDGGPVTSVARRWAHPGVSAVASGAGVFPWRSPRVGDFSGPLRRIVLGGGDGGRLSGEPSDARAAGSGERRAARRGAGRPAATVTGRPESFDGAQNGVLEAGGTIA